MALKQKPKAGAARLDSPELPTAEEGQFLPGNQFESDGRYDNLILTDAELANELADNLVIEHSRFTRVVMSEIRFKQMRLSDVRFEKCDLANADWSRTSLNRVELVACRITGFRFLDGNATDVRLDQCKADLAQFRGTAFRNSRFENCNLRECDLRLADLRNVRFEDCDLTGAEFYGAKLDGADLRGSLLEGIKFDKDGLAGAIIDNEQLLTLSRSLAYFAGLTVE